MSFMEKSLGLNELTESLIRERVRCPLCADIRCNASKGDDRLLVIESCHIQSSENGKPFTIVHGAVHFPESVRKILWQRECFLADLASWHILH